MAFIKTKTSELKGVALDWAVAQAEGHAVYIKKHRIFGYRVYFQASGVRFHPSSNFTQGGEIIESGKISINCPRGFDWQAETWAEKSNPITGHHRFGSGETFLIAAMRCRVSDKFGDELLVSDELLG